MGNAQDDLTELRRVRDAAVKLLELLERLAEITDDAERGRALLDAMRTQPLFAVPPKK